MANLKFDVDLNTSKATQKLSAVSTAITGRMSKGVESTGASAMSAIMLPVEKGFGVISTVLTEAGKKFWQDISLGMDKAKMALDQGFRAGEMTKNALGMGAAFMSDDAIKGVMGVHDQITGLSDTAALNVSRVQQKHFPARFAEAGKAVAEGTQKQSSSMVDFIIGKENREKATDFLEMVWAQTVTNETLNKIADILQQGGFTTLQNFK